MILAEALVDCIGGKLSDVAAAYHGVCIDSRCIKPKQCFIAITGETFDGHNFVEEAYKAGASLAVVSKPGDYPLPVIEVVDTADALGKIATSHRKQFSLPVLALTGSCGKTTVKEMLASILPPPSFATKGNLNNHLGVPLSLLSLRPEHRYGVFELGANHIGEIARTVAWVKPEVALITNVAPAHLDGFGSIEGVAKAKNEIFSGLNSEGIALINIDDSNIVVNARKVLCRTLSFSLENPSADIFAKDIGINDKGTFEFTLHVCGDETQIQLKVPGRHNIANAVAASAAAKALDIPLLDITRGLNAFAGVSGRMTIKQGIKGIRLIDDTYNANLSSVKAAIDSLSCFEGKRVVVLGELSEVGDKLSEHYQAIAQYAKARGIEFFYTCGDQTGIVVETFGEGGVFFEDQKALVDYLKPKISEDMSILVKGSRSAKMEKVVECFIG
jgi:UDP-N-acetylmuramoyl-tripeptide--D-alanyl-D-alanine ligase